MQHRQQPSSQGNISESEQHTEGSISTADMLEELRQQEHLMSLGFTWDQTRKLQHQRTHIYENVEMQQRMADDSRILFARWLYEQGEINEK